VEHVLGDVPRSERCRCHESPPKVAAKAKVRAAAESQPTSSFGRLKDWLQR
jgi:hypothetical protein